MLMYDRNCPLYSHGGKRNNFKSVKQTSLCQLARSGSLGQQGTVLGDSGMMRRCIVSMLSGDLWEFLTGIGIEHLCVSFKEVRGQGCLVHCP